MPFSAPVLTYRAKALASNMCSKVLNGHIILTDTSITTILAPEMTYTPRFLTFLLLFVFRFGERAVRRGFSFERNVRRGTADSAARSERGEARRQETEKPRIRGMQGFVELPGFEPGITGPESVVLPLHHSSIDFGDAKVELYFANAKKNPEKISYICFNLRRKNRLKLKIYTKSENYGN